MRFRSGLTKSHTQLPFSGRYLTRLLLLAGFCIIAMVALGLSAVFKPQGQRASHREPGNQSGPVIQTAMAPSPFGELGMGVIIADDQPKQTDGAPTDPLRLPDSSPGQLPAVDQNLLLHVLDKTTDRPKRPFYHLLTLVGTVEADLLNSHARRYVTYRQLWDEPEKFRGELIHLEGIVRGLHPWQATENEFFNPAGFKTLYDGYLVSDDSRPNAFVIVLPRVADGMPTGANIAERIEFAGYFLKLWRYKAADGTERAAPLLVGQMISWTPAPEPERFVQLSGYLAVGFLLLVLSIAGAIWLVNRRNRQGGAIAELSPVSDAAVLNRLAALERLDIPDPIAGLGQSSGEAGDTKA